MIVDALILAGGRSSRLGDSDKRNLRISGETLLARAIRAAREAGVRSVAVVGDGVDGEVVVVREEPAFGGPVAAIDAGMRALAPTPDAVLVLACDMPDIHRALPPLLAGFRGDGAIAVDRGRAQQLAIVVEPGALRRALASLPAVTDAAMRVLLAPLDLTQIAVPDGSTDDIDTWDDAARFGAAPMAGATHE